MSRDGRLAKYVEAPSGGGRRAFIPLGVNRCKEMQATSFPSGFEWCANDGTMGASDFDASEVYVAAGYSPTLQHTCTRTRTIARSGQLDDARVFVSGAGELPQCSLSLPPPPPRQSVRHSFARPPSPGRCVVFNWPLRAPGTPSLPTRSRSTSTTAGWRKCRM